jgi:hypothetical protein
MVLSAGNLGIGTTTPAVRLHVEDGSVFIGDTASLFSTTVPSAPGAATTPSGYRLFFDNSFNLTPGTGTPANKIVLHNNNFTGGFGIEAAAVTYHSGASHNFYINANTGSTYGTQAMVINSNVGIGLSNPSYKLHVSGQIYATGDIVAFSDTRYKQDLQVIANSLDKVQQLTGYTYTMTTQTEKEDNTKVTPRYTGILAQDLEQALPEAVHKDPEGKMSVAYGNLAGLFVESIKELTQENKQLKEQLASLQQRLAAVENKLA